MALVGKKTESTPSGLALVLGKANPLSDPRMRALVRSAVAEGNYAAVQDAHTLAVSLKPASSELWSWWLDGVESLAQSSDPDLRLFVSFTRNVAGIAPWGNLLASARARLRALER